jgi:hypothetical protein
VRRNDHDFVEFYIAEGACGECQLAVLQREGKSWRFGYIDMSADQAPDHHFWFWISEEGDGLHLQTDANGS